MNFRWIGQNKEQTEVILKNISLLKIPLAPYATPEWIRQNQDLVRTAAVVDLETTGLSYQDEEIIEIGLQIFQYNQKNGDILNLLESYESFQEPQKKLRSDITLITGITEEMLLGQKIDWPKVDSLLATADIIIAHNARFDRPFLDQKSKVSGQKIWGCSLKQVNWLQRGYTSSKLELLSIYHGFFTQAHRALNDAQALLYLLAQTDPLDERRNYLAELLAESKKPLVHVIALSAPFETKDLLKRRGYSWDNQNKFWSKVILEEQNKEETKWLEENVYLGPFRGLTRDIQLAETFKT